jgi:branched-chain amino acid transport system ATP-binding protein
VSALLSMQDVVVRRGAREVLRGVSVEVGEREIVALLGPNGAGKSTTLRAMTGFLPGDRASVVNGSVRVAGRSMDSQAPHRCGEHGIALIPERDKIFPTLTVEENIRLGAMANPRRAEVPALREQMDQLFPVLRERHQQQAGYLSGGERQMLAIASALVGGPSVLLVDELSLGLAPKVVGELIQVLRMLNTQRGLTILLVEQSAHVAFAIADYVYVLNVGKVVLEGTPHTLRERDDFRETYLGLGRPGKKVS